jgi:hypothetical protein
LIKHIVKKTRGRALKADKDGIVIGPVYQPLRLDSQNEATIREEIKKQAYNFMLNGRWDAIDIEHDKKKSGCRVVESFIVRDGDPEYTPGDWVLAAKVFDEDLLERVEKGELNAWSFSGKVVLSSDTVVNGLNVKVTDLVHSKKKGVIAKSDVQVRYAGYGHIARVSNRVIPRHYKTFDTLMNTAPATISPRKVYGRYRKIRQA